MHRFQRACSAFAALAALLVCTAAAAAADVPGSKDHPLLTRFKGAVITHYQTRDFDEAVMPIKPIAEPDKVAATDLATAEGKITRIDYSVPGNKTALEVMRNYEQALAAAGFQTLFQCGGDRCGRGMGGYLANSEKVLPLGFNASFDPKNRYLAARRSNAQGDVSVLLWVAEDGANERTLVFEQVVEARPMATGQVSVLTAADLKKGIDSTGSVAIYGIQFDTAKADIKPESRPSLDEMAKLLAANPAMRVYIVGHTDNVGQLAANLDLSQRRAEAVAKALAGMKIDPQRMVAKGVASLAPVAANTNDAGRARNRRVELVLQ